MTYWSISSQVLREEAENLGLEVEILIPEKNLFIITGNDKKILFKSTDFGGNTSLAEKIANDKELTYALLARYNIPIPRTLYMQACEWYDFDWTRFSVFRWPLVIKPIDEAHGQGVYMSIATLPELQVKLEYAFSQYPRMIIQEQVLGEEYRVLVVLGEVVLVIHRIPPCVIGDGSMSIRELIDSENTNNPLRQQDYFAPLSLIRMDDELIDHIGKQGYHLDDILEKGIRIQLRGNSNLGTGGTLEDVTHLVHPDIKRMCTDLAQRLGFSLCGVDILSSDISRTLSETGGVVLELNATPGIGGDRELTSVNSGREILKRLFFGEI